MTATVDRDGRVPSRPDKIEKIIVKKNRKSKNKRETIKRIDGRNFNSLPIMSATTE
jgi:hypothetical protein